MRSTHSRRRLPGWEDSTHPIRRRSSRSSTSPMQNGCWKPSTVCSTMAEEVFRLPDLGEGLTEAQLVKWRVETGEQVEVNAPLCEVETAKAVVVIPSPFGGRVSKLHANPGETVPVGSPLI